MTPEEQQQLDDTTAVAKALTAWVRELTGPHADADVFYKLVESEVARRTMSDATQHQPQQPGHGGVMH